MIAVGWINMGVTHQARTIQPTTIRLRISAPTFVFFKFVSTFLTLPKVKSMLAS